MCSHGGNGAGVKKIKTLKKYPQKWTKQEKYDEPNKFLFVRILYGSGSCMRHACTGNALDPWEESRRGLVRVVIV
jgi:hypothetical protein